MTEIDMTADIDLVLSEQGSTVRIPLAGTVDADWCQRYQAMARRAGQPVRAESSPARGWVVVALPAGADREEIQATLDAARDLVAKVDSAAGETTEEAATVVRDWWASQHS